MHSDDVELWTAARTVAMHVAGDGCGQCPPVGPCGLYRWADVRLRQWETERGEPYPVQAPGWSGVGAST
jgi:hypothetical protein